MTTRTPAAAAAELALHREVALRLAMFDQRYTRNRRALVEALLEADRPSTIGELLELAPAVPKSTAYRTLTLLGEVGVVRRVSGADDFGRFELSEELSGHHHHHVVCGTCGLVMDVTASPHLEQALEETARAIAVANGFAIEEHRLELLGTCSGCR